MVKKINLTLNDETEKELQRYRDHDQRPYVRERCAALLKIAAGQSARTVASKGLLKKRRPETVLEWVAWYRSEGIAGLINHQQGGYRRDRL